MPPVKIDLYPGRSPTRKHEVAEAIARVFVEQRDCAPKGVSAIFNDTPPRD